MLNRSLQRLVGSNPTPTANFRGCMKESVAEFIARGGTPSQHKMGETAIDPNIGIPKTKAKRYYKSGRKGTAKRKNVPNL